ncbi:hypothetical protein [Cryptosporangium phraense]|uniref:Uncharacterized protein n=1 Tax=Cryptosporangium phraense TaxID=2593070 RepID=A0A545AXH5_9ACTN|nr:hypothetical protein [Cryptosporangium phraense]TQS46036.1 hypothetical protein FL583_05985 [Cryptosporangium phraense]
MNEFEHTVRTMLTERAVTVPEQPGLVDGVHRIVRRNRNRRRAVVGAALAIVLIAAGSVAWGAQRPDDHLVPAGPSSTSPTASPSGLPPVTAPAAPLRVGYLPKGFDRPTVTIDSVHSWTITTVRDAPSAVVEIQVSMKELGERDSGRLKYAKTETVEVQGTKATLSVVPSHPGWPDLSHQSYWGPYSELTFARTNGQWVRIEAYNADETTVDPEVSEADLQAIAAGLTDGPTPVADLLRFPALPAGLTIASLDRGSPGTPANRTATLQLGYPSDPLASTNEPYGGAQWDLERAPVVVLAGADGSVVPTLLADPATFTTLQVDGHEVRTYSKGYPGRTVLTTTFGPDRRIALSADTKLGLSAPRLARFLLAIRPGADFG